jgi:hypothetical protein
MILNACCCACAALLAADPVQSQKDRDPGWARAWSERGPLSRTSKPGPERKLHILKSAGFISRFQVFRPDTASCSGFDPIPGVLLVMPTDCWAIKRLRNRTENCGAGTPCIISFGAVWWLCKLTAYYMCLLDLCQALRLAQLHGSALAGLICLPAGACVAQC